jgi:EmrB/QacA subfamily drug resistance transporter
MSNQPQQNNGIEKVKAPYLQLFIILLGAFMAVLDTSVVNVAIPTMETELNANTDQIQWVITGYMLATGVLIPISGWLMDKIGPKKLFLFSLVTFTIGSALCGAAWNLNAEIAFRILQAVGGGFTMPVAMAMIYRIFPIEKRGMVMGMFGIVIMVAPAFGPALSGYLVEYTTWRLIFYVNVPIGIAATFFAIFLLHEFPHQVKGKLDVWGMTLTIVGFFLILYGFNEVSTDGWTSLTVVSCLAIGTSCLIMLVFVELLTENPVIELRVLKSYMFTMSLVITSILNVALFVGIFLLPLYLQDIMGYSALRTGLFMTPAAIASAVMMMVGGKLFNVVGARVLGIIGIGILTVGTYGFCLMGLDTTSAYIQMLYIVRSLGMGLAMMPITTEGMNAVPIELVAQGTAVSNTTRQIASSLGTAILTSYWSTHSTKHIAELSNILTPSSPTGIQLNLFQSHLQATGMSAPAAHMQALLSIHGWINKMGFVDGLNDTFFVSTLLAFAAVVVTCFFGSRKAKAVRMQHAAARKPASSKATAPALSE